MARGGFGLSSSRGRARGGSFRAAGFRGGGSWRGGRGRGRGGGGRGGAGRSADAAPVVREDDGTQLAEKFERAAQNDEIDEKLGFARVDQGLKKEGWLINMHPVRNFSSFFLCVMRGDA